MTQPSPQTELNGQFQAFHQASRAEPPWPAARRRDLLKRLRGLLTTNQAKFAGAIAKDFGHRSHQETMLCEVVPALQAIDDALAHLSHWMKPERRPTPIYFWPSSSRVLYQPKGVVAVISPWNYPLLLALGPVVAAIAAGNRVIIKPSELTPFFSDLLARLINAELSDAMYVATGGSDVAQAVTALPLDHILFTGSTRVGGLVMQAAAKTLTPVTLELGGKSPAIVDDSFPIDVAAERIAHGKLINAGQTCIAPDYVLVPAEKIEAFCQSYQAAAQRFYPDIASNRDYTGIISEQHYDRLNGLIADARDGGADIREVFPSVDSAGSGNDLGAHRMLPVLMTGMSDSLQVMQEEIFGPILPVVPFDRLDDAIAYVNQRPRPLALYYFDHSRKRRSDVLQRTLSGGVTLNDTIFHVALETLPFGGIGPSGIGSYHGRDGFLTFSHARAVFQRSAWTRTELLHPPYGTLFQRLMKGMRWWLNGR
jgi:coniferyl-aldehyde dehydrogenase